MNGDLLPDDDATVSVFDHGLVVGDGVFETIKVAEGVPFAMTRHLARLRTSALGLGLPEPDLEHVRAGALGENVRALAYAAERGGNEAIFGNTVGQLCEGTGTNVFVVIGGRLLTPPLTSGCLAGVTRALVIEWTGAEEEDLALDSLATADEAFLSGTTRDVQPIRRVDGKELPAAPGPVTKKAAEIFALRSAESPDP